jgi:uncharacterized protein
MGLEQRITDDYMAALRAGDETRKATLRLLRAALKNATIEARHPLSDEEVTKVLHKEARQRQDSIEQYQAGHRMDLVAAEKAELETIESYLPQPLTADEIEAAARAQIAAVGATGPGDMGKVMGPLIKHLGPRADGGLVQATVRRLLSG